MPVLCLHGHLYQPPREHPWLGVVEPEPSAAPFRDWNARIAAECYTPLGAARVLDAHGRLASVVNTYAWTSFDLGPTLGAWLAAGAPAALEALRAGDAAGRARTGHGNAWAQAYAHPILPLSARRDVRTQVLWGQRDFAHRFGRPPEGMWLPEMAVDLPSLEALAEAGIGLTMLSPHQARRVRRVGAEAWTEVTPASLDTRRLYRCALPSGRAVDIVFRDATLSHDVAFEGLLGDGARLAARLRAAAEAAGERGVVTVAVDAETYGHHHRFGEMALAFALRVLVAEGRVELANPAAVRARQPPEDEVEVIAATSWSCPHGVERWRADCGCRVGAEAGGSQAWRAPLRRAIDWLRDELAHVYETQGGEVLRDPWGARDRYIECVLAPERTGEFVAAEAARPLSSAARVHARRALELARHALLMQASCGWFFDELAGIEPVLVLRHAARALELAERLGARLEDGFVAHLEPARSNLAGGEDGANLYRRGARGAAATPARVAATGALLHLLGCAATLPGYEAPSPPADASGRLVAEVPVVESATGAVTVVGVAAERGADGAPVARADGTRFGLGDLFGVQRERLAAALGREAAAAMRAILARQRPVLEALVAEGTLVSREVAALLGWDGAMAVAEALSAGAASLPALTARVEVLRDRGAVFPADWLAPHIARALERRLADLPQSAAAALALLDLAGAAGVALDLERAQVLALVWWRRARPAHPEAHLTELARRLSLVPVEAA